MKTTLLSLFALFCFTIAARAGLDPTSHVFIIVMENHNWSSIKGSADAPYINNTLLPMASYCDQYYNPPGLHPSEPNYLWLEAGTNFGITNDNAPSDGMGGGNHQTSLAHFATRLKNAGISWKAYQEDIDGLSCPTADSPALSGMHYAVRHNPFVFFDDVANAGTPSCASVIRPFSELSSDLINNNIGQYNFLTPNTCNNMHDSCAPTSNLVKQGDDWLAANLPTILSSSAYQNNGLIIITWDEGENGTDGPIGCIVLSPLGKGGGYHSSIRYTHSATLRTLQKIFGATPFLGGATFGNDLGDLFVAGALPNADPPPTVTTTSAFNVGGGNATLAGSINPNGDATSNWFEYGLTTAYGSDTISRSSDDAESYSGWAYGNNGGSGFGPAEYIEGTGGGLFLPTAANGNRQIDGSKSFGVFAGSTTGNTQGMGRSITNPQAAGTLTLSVRFDLSNAVGFSGFNLKSAKGTSWGGTNGSELISVGLRTANGNNTIAINGGAQTINLGSEIRGQIIDFVLNYDSTAGTYQLGAKFRASSTFTTTTGPLKIVGQPPTYLGFGNFNGGAANQNLIVDSLSLVDSQSAGNGTSPVSKVYNLTGFTPNTTYHYRAVAQNTRGITYGADKTFGFPLQPPNDATFHSSNSSSGTYQARIYDATGHIAVAEPDLNGNPLANVIMLAPPSAKVNGAAYDFGPVQSVTNIPNGVEIVQSVADTQITSQLTFTSEGVMHYEVTNWNGLVPTETDIAAASDPSEHFYGFGEKFNSLDQAGNRVDIMTNDQGGDKNDFTYKSSSWFISSRGYGFHLDSTAESFFDMRKTATDRYTVQNLFSTLKFNVVAGPKLTDVLTRYTGYIGRPYLPPPWVFGTWVSSDIWRTGGEVRYAITKHRDSGIPISVFVFDSPWEVSYNDFIWNMTQFGAGGTYEGTTSHPSATYAGFTSLNEMMTFFQQNGVKVVCWFTPFINTSSFNDNVGGATPGQNTGKSPNYDFAASNGYFVKTSTSNSNPLSVNWWKGTGSPIDFTNPAATNWFLTTQLQPLVDGSKVTTANSNMEPVIGGFKTDDGEALNAGSPYIPTTASYSDGRTGVEMRNGYAIAYHGAISSLLGSNGILFSR
ncbi:MAG TPA: alkaline phosphatase family protein, partial [Chthoniobacterales bacterium]